MIRRLGFGAAVAAAAAIQLAAQTTDSTITSDTYKALKFRYVGPVGNRIRSLPPATFERPSVAWR